MARPRIKLAHEREVLRLRTARTAERIRIADARDRIRKIDAELEGMKPKKQPGAPTT